MSHFYGYCQGNRGKVTRCGTKKSGYTTVAASYSGAVEVNVWYNEEYDEDWCEVSLVTWLRAGQNILLYRGAIDGSEFSVRSSGGV